MGNIITKVLPGFMELLPEEQIEFDRIKNVILSTYERFGFTPIDTPAIERGQTLLAKAGGETAKQIYSVENKRGGTGVADDKVSEPVLRFDLTVPLARYVAEHFNDLSFPFRRCHIAKAYRGERPQRGRFREFYQCDIDVIGRDKLSIRYDAEIPSIIYQIFKQLDFGKFTIRVNNRKLLSGLIESLGITADAAEVLRIIDKIEKISPEAFESMLKENNLTEAQVAGIKRFMAISGKTEDVLKALKGLNIDNELFNLGLEELSTVTAAMEEMGVDRDYYQIDLSIARGLDYYTGTVYETKLDDHPQIGSVCSGGRFDNLASHYISEKLPGVGMSIGLTRLFDQLRAIGVVSGKRKTIADAVIVPMDESNIATALNAAAEIRKNGFNADVLLEDWSVKNKFKYVSKKDATFTVVIGSDEERDNVIVLQYKQGDEIIKERLPLDKAIAVMIGFKKEN
ncbi:MAG: histidine--tRNA ligase [Clostridiales bacterium]|nr:histidine--tRNA ligase [Clostridiales bacterium]